MRRFCVNLSVTIEESFGKAPIEALGSGIPVLATRWDGLPETVGECGVLLPSSARPGVSADIAAESVADGLQRLLDGPPSAAACRRQAGRFAPSACCPGIARLSRPRRSPEVPLATVVPNRRAMRIEPHRSAGCWRRRRHSRPCPGASSSRRTSTAATTCDARGRATRRSRASAEWDPAAGHPRAGREPSWADGPRA